MTFHRRIVLGVATLALSSCGPVDDATADPFDPAKLPQLQTSEVIRLGGYDERPAFTFASIPAAAVLSDQQVALVERQANEIRVFDLNGDHVRTFGGSGDGPGEFKFLSALQPLSGDRLIAWGFQGKRISLFDFDGTHIRSSTIPIAGMAGLWTNFVGAFPDGSVVLRSDPSEMALRNEPDGFRREPTHFLRYTHGEARPDTLCTVLGPEKYLYHQDQSWGLEDRLFDRQVAGAVVDEAVLCGTTDHVDLRRVSPSGAELPRLEHPRPARAISDSEVEQERARLLAEMKERREQRTRAGRIVIGATASGSSVQEDRRATTEAFDTRPAYKSVRTGSDGGLWIEDYPAPGDSHIRWIQLDGDRPVGWLEVDVGETVLGFGHGLLLKRVKDDLGVESVVVMRVSGQ